MAINQSDVNYGSQPVGIWLKLLFANEMRKGGVGGGLTRGCKIWKLGVEGGESEGLNSV